MRRRHRGATNTAELLELVAREVGGRTPAGRPAATRWKPTSLDRRALGGRGLGTDQFPAPDRPLRGDWIGYHLRPGAHDITPYDWAQYLEFADRHLKRAPRP